MAHKTDGVTWWNDAGRNYGAKSPEVRKWMLDSNNYYLDHYSINRSQGAKLGQNYLHTTYIIIKRSKLWNWKKKYMKRY